MQSMEEIYQEHAQMIYKYLLTQVRDPGLAEELTQETFYQAVRSANAFDGTSKVSTWLCAIAKNCLRTHLRKHPRTEELEEALPSEQNLEGEQLARETRYELLRKVQVLSPEAREVLYLRLFGDLSFRQIGDILSKSENWARVTFYRAKEKLRKELEEHGI